MRDMNLLKELTQLWGVAGYEKEVRKYIEKIVEPYADEMLTDAVGNLIVLKKGRGGAEAKKIMLAARVGILILCVPSVRYLLRAVTLLLQSAS